MAVPFSENGGFVATTYYLFIPVQSSDTGTPYIAIFDPTSFNDLNDDSTYSYRQEDIVPGRVPTVRRIILTYRDIGTCTITVTISGINDNGSVVSSSAKVSLGTPQASGNLLTKLVDLTFTGYRPQLSYTRTAGNGPLSVVSASMVGTIEDQTL